MSVSYLSHSIIDWLTYRNPSVVEEAGVILAVILAVSVKIVTAIALLVAVRVLLDGEIHSSFIPSSIYS